MSRQKWCTEPNGYLEPCVETEGGTEAARKPKTIIDVLKNTVAKHGSEKAMGLKRGTKVGPLDSH